MKSFERVATPARIPTNLSPGKMAEEINKRLAELARQMNNAIDTLSAPLADSGDWGSFVDVTFALNHTHVTGITDADTRDIPVMHALGAIPTRWKIVDVMPGRFSIFVPTPEDPTNVEPIAVAAFLWRAPTPWTSTAVFFRAETNAWFCDCRYVVRLYAK